METPPRTYLYLSRARALFADFHSLSKHLSRTLNAVPILSGHALKGWAFSGRT